MSRLSSGAASADSVARPVRMLLASVTKRAMDNAGTWYDTVINLNSQKANDEYRRLTQRRPAPLRPAERWEIRKERRPNGWAVQVRYTPPEGTANA